jgi:hypothetical protein
LLERRLDGLHKNARGSVTHRAVDLCFMDVQTGSAELSESALGLCPVQSAPIFSLF